MKDPLANLRLMKIKIVDTLRDILFAPSNFNEGICSQEYLISANKYDLGQVLQKRGERDRKFRTKCLKEF